MHDRRGQRSVHRWRRPGSMAALCVAAWLLIACGPAPTTAPIATPPIATLAPSAEPTVPATSPSAAPPATTPPTEPTAAGTTACTAADIKASHGLVEGAAGSLLTEVVLVAAIPCSVDASPALGLRDATGAAIVGGVASSSGRIELSPELAYTSNVQFANWCNPEPTFPLELTLRLGGEEVPVTGGSFPDEGRGMPPCNGESVAPVLEGTVWAAGT